MATYVLVHGAWGGAHGFRKVRPLLAAQGHQVFTPALTGIGERVHLASPQVTLTTHVQDVANLVLYEDLVDLVLLGFSYGGMVVTGALEHVADRLRHLVYLDAFVPADGESLYALTGQLAGRPVLEPGAPWLVPPIARFAEEGPEAAWFEARRTPHPIGCFTEPVHLARSLESFAFGRTYVKATGEPRPEAGHPFWTAGDHAKASPAWHYHEIATNHLIPVNRPEELAALLLDLD